MNLVKTLLPILVLALFTTLTFSKGNNRNVSALGFDFRISKKQALEIIKSQGKKIIEDAVDSKKIRTVVVEGAFIELPVDTSLVDLRTKLEFYDNELMASSLVFKSNDPLKRSELEAELFRFLIGLYGEPSKKEEILHFTTWTWRIPDVAVILSSDPNNNVARIEYVYEPLNQIRKEEEYERQQKGEPVDKAKELFLK